MITTIVFSFIIVSLVVFTVAVIENTRYRTNDTRAVLERIFNEK